MHPPKSYLILLQVIKTHPTELSGLQWFSMRAKPESGSLPSLTHKQQLAKAVHVPSPDPIKQNHTQKANRKKIQCFMSEVASTQADHAIYSYFTLRISSK